MTKKGANNFRVARLLPLPPELVKNSTQSAEQPAFQPPVQPPVQSPAPNPNMQGKVERGKGREAQRVKKRLENFEPSQSPAVQYILGK